MNVVTPEEIQLLPRRYAIGKRPLSLLLGWGELTYTRLIDGNTPTAEHAAELRLLIDDPAVYARKLEIGRDRVTGMAYSRSFNAVDAILAEKGGAYRATRVFAVADRICRLAEGDITPNALQRLLYYSQGTSMAADGDALFDELPRAGASGPMYDRVSAYYDFAEIQRAASGEVEVDTQLLSKREMQLVDSVYGKLCDFSSAALSEKSRKEAPWKKARKRAQMASGANGDGVITSKSMKKWFSKNPL